MRVRWSPQKNKAPPYCTVGYGSDVPLPPNRTLPAKGSIHPAAGAFHVDVGFCL